MAPSQPERKSDFRKEEEGRNAPGCEYEPREIQDAAGEYEFHLETGLLAVDLAEQ